MFKWVLTFVLCVFIIGIVMPMVGRRSVPPGERGTAPRGPGTGMSLGMVALMAGLLWLVLRVF